MKRIVFFFTLLVVALSATVAMAADKANEAVAVFKVEPAMHCQNCENKIKTNLRHERGVIDIQTNLKDQTVTIKYKTQATDTDKLINAFKKLGYTATISTGAKSCNGEYKCSGNCGKHEGKNEGKACSGSCGNCKKNETKAAAGACCGKHK